MPGAELPFLGLKRGCSGSRWLGAILLRRGSAAVAVYYPREPEPAGGLEARRRRSSPRYDFLWLLTLLVGRGAAVGTACEVALGQQHTRGHVPVLPREQVRGEQARQGNYFWKFLW